MADFETRTAAYNENETSVWLVYSENINDQYDNILEISLTRWFNNFVDLIKKPTTIFFHNLNFDGEFLMNWLADNATYVKPTDSDRQVKLGNNHWTNMSDGVSSHYRITYKNTKGVNVNFKCSLKLLQASVSSLQGVKEKDKIDYDFLGEYNSPTEVSDEHRKYIVSDVRSVITPLKHYIETLGKDTGLTSASSAQRNMKSFMGAKNFDQLFKGKIKAGEIDEKNNLFKPGEWDYYSNFYVGGWTIVGDGKQRQLIKSTDNSKIRVFDVNSLYPYVMRHLTLPYGYAITSCKCKGKQHPLQLLEIILTADLKPGGVPFIPDTNKQATIDWLAHMKNKVVYLTNDMWDLVQKEYDIKYSQIIKTTCFNGKQDTFNDFFDYWQAEKQRAKKADDKPAYALSKNIQNSTYGKFGMDYKRKQMFLRPHDPNIDVRKGITTYGKKKPLVFDYRWDLSEPLYIPMALWVSSHAKLITIKLASYVNKLCNHVENAGFLYSDTDSVHCLICDDCYKVLQANIDIDPMTLGAWDEEGSYNYAFYVGRKKYIEFNDLDSKDRNIGFAGVDVLALDKYTNSDIIKGRAKFTKKAKTKVVGGVLLIEKQVNIN